MGLAGPRKRRKIGEDPNNTAWANSTTGFGHKIMSAQGWTPGSYLGATNAAHASHYSAANASHIRVALKEDNLGLGAKKGQAEGQQFGLGGFQDLLGRLNGKSEVAIEKEQAIRADLGRKLYAEQKWGPSRFVRGGYLVGDKIEEGQPKPLPASTVVNINPQNSEEESEISVNSEVGSGDGEAATRALDSENNTRVEKQKKKKPGKKDGETKEERRQRKLERRARKEAKRQLRSISALGNLFPEQSKTDLTFTGTSDAGRAVGQAVVETPGSHAAATILSSIPVNPGSRMAVRQRYIKQKRMASMNPQALKEILMLK